MKVWIASCPSDSATAGFFCASTADTTAGAGSCAFASGAPTPASVAPASTSAVALLANVLRVIFIFCLLRLCELFGFW